MRATKKETDEDYRDTALHLGDLYMYFDPPYVYIGGWDMGDIEQLDANDAYILAKYLLNKVMKLKVSE